MSRSRRKTPIVGMAVCDSEKSDKTLWRRRFRRKVKQAIGCKAEMPEICEISSTWDMGKDGKQYIDAELHPDEMRK